MRAVRAPRGRPLVVFEPLRDVTYFAKAFVVKDSVAFASAGVESRHQVL